MFNIVNIMWIWQPDFPHVRHNSISGVIMIIKCRSTSHLILNSIITVSFMIIPHHFIHTNNSTLLTSVPHVCQQWKKLTLVYSLSSSSKVNVCWFLCHTIIRHLLMRSSIPITYPLSKILSIEYIYHTMI